MNTLTPTTENAVERFLQSVLVIDDRAQYGSAPPVGKLKDPDEERGAPEQIRDQDESLTPTEPPESILDAKELVDAFAALGLVCGVMRPEPPQEPETSNVIPAASRADIIVVDWHLQDTGERALRILKALSEVPGLRLAAVYTYDDALEAITDRIAQHLGGTHDGRFRISVGDFVVEVYAKRGTDLGTDPSQRVKAPSDLALALIADFGRITRGIVPTAAVAAVGALRRNTPLLLSLLTSELDPGYLGHRILLPDPEDSERHLLDLIGAEMRTVIEDDSIVRAAINQAAIGSHLEELTPYDKQLPLNVISRALEIGTSRTSAKEELRKIPDVIAEPENERLGAQKPSQTHRFTSGDKTKGQQADLLFGRRMSLRTTTATPPYLQTGTFVRHGEVWLVCVQPDCDAVRLDAERQFPFLPVKRVALTEQLDAVVSIDGEDVALRIEPVLHRLRQIDFRPDPPTRVVMAAGGPDRWLFKSSRDGDYEFVAQFKRDHARRLAERFTQAGSRVGLDESEMFRRWGDRKR